MTAAMVMVMAATLAGVGTVMGHGVFKGGGSLVEAADGGYGWGGHVIWEGGRTGRESMQKCVGMGWGVVYLVEGGGGKGQGKDGGGRNG